MQREHCCVCVKKAEMHLMGGKINRANNHFLHYCDIAK